MKTGKRKCYQIKERIQYELDQKRYAEARMFYPWMQWTRKEDVIGNVIVPSINCINDQSDCFIIGYPRFHEQPLFGERDADKW